MDTLLRYTLPRELLDLIFDIYLRDCQQSALVLCEVASWTRLIGIPSIWRYIELDSLDNNKLKRLEQILYDTTFPDEERICFHVHAILAMDRLGDDESAALRLISGCPNVEHVLLNSEYCGESFYDMLTNSEDGLFGHFALTVIGDIEYFDDTVLSTTVLNTDLTDSPVDYQVTHFCHSDELVSLDVRSYREVWPKLEYLAIPAYFHEELVTLQYLDEQLAAADGMKQFVLLHPMRGLAVLNTPLLSLRKKYPFFFVAWNALEFPNRDPDCTLSHFDDIVLQLWIGEVVHGGISLWDAAVEQTAEWERILTRLGLAATDD